MRNLFPLLMAGALFAGCSDNRESDGEAASEASWNIAQAAIFPADGGLQRAEDGVQLPDGTLIVADQRYGLVKIASDGSFEPFGEFAAVGFAQEPAGIVPGPNGVHMDPDGRHILVADVFTGRIYRTDIEAGVTELVYAHPFGVNTAITDSTGAVWFTQSTKNQGEERLFEAVDRAMGDGAIYRIPMGEDGRLASEPELVVDGLDFPNGFYIDEANGKLFLSETLANRVLAFTLDVTAGTLNERSVLAVVPSPDNMRLAPDGSLWVASPASNRVLAVNTDFGTTRVVFDAQTEAGAMAAQEWLRRTAAGESAAQPPNPDVLGKMPGMLTGVITGRPDQPFYISNLGTALVKVER